MSVQGWCHTWHNVSLRILGGLDLLAFGKHTKVQWFTLSACAHCSVSTAPSWLYGIYCHCWCRTVKTSHNTNLNHSTLFFKQYWSLLSSNHHSPFFKVEHGTNELWLFSMENTNFAEHLHVSVMPVWVYSIFLRCENLLTASWFWLEYCFSGTVFFIFIQFVWGATGIPIWNLWMH